MRAITGTLRWAGLVVLAGGAVFQGGCLVSEQQTEALITSSITTAIQVIVNTVFFSLDSFFVSAS